MVIVWLIFHFFVIFAQTGETLSPIEVSVYTIFSLPPLIFDEFFQSPH